MSCTVRESFRQTGTTAPYHPQEPLQSRPTLSASGTTAEPSARPPQPHRSHTDAHTIKHPQRATQSHRTGYTVSTTTMHHTRPGAAHKAHRATIDRRSIHRTPTAIDSHARPLHAPITALLIHYPTITLLSPYTALLPTAAALLPPQHYISAADLHSTTLLLTGCRPPQHHAPQHHAPQHHAQATNGASLTNVPQSLAEPSAELYRAVQRHSGAVRASTAAAHLPQRRQHHRRSHTATGRTEPDRGYMLPLFFFGLPP